MDTPDTTTDLDAAVASAALVLREPDEAAGPDFEGEDPCKTMKPDEAWSRLARGEAVRNVTIERMTFRGDVAHAVILDRVRLVQPLFEKVAFAEEVSFRGCTLDRPKFNRRVEFLKGLDVRNATFSSAIIRVLVVRGEFCADNLKVRGRFVLANAEFHGPARFWQTRFECWIDIKDCKFHGLADFRSVHADEGIVFANCEFRGDFLFRGSTVEKKFEANGSRFEAMLDLAKAKLHDFVYLEGIEQGPNQRFAFKNALAERLLLRTDQIVGRLDSEEKGDHASAMEEYGLLKRGFEGLHRYEQEDWAFYRFKVNARRARTRTWRKPWSKLGQFFDWLLLDLGCGYGTNPLRAVRASLVIMLVFGLVYMADVGSLGIEHLPFPKLGPTAWPNRILAGLLASVTVFTSGFGSIRDMGQGWLLIPLILESLLGTFLWGLFIVAFSRKVIR